MRVLIVGCGYTGCAVGTALAKAGHHVAGMRRKASAETLLKSLGIQPIIADATVASDWRRLTPDYDWVINTVSSGGGTASDYRQIYLQTARNLMDWLVPNPPGKLIYTSSTGVYGQNNGELVTEDSPTNPEAETAQVLVETERLLLQAIPSIVLRVAGIYGPGRGYWLKQFLNGDARLEDKGDRYLNMVHQDDVAGALIASCENGQPGEVYNVVDDEPVQQVALFQWLAAHFGKPMPAQAELPSPTRKRGVTNKRVSNAKLKRELHYRFKYPSFREAVRAGALDLAAAA
jgi:nucleoside-diphosphate-sugar epimerase